MAKDNQRKASDPGAKKNSTTEQSKPGTERPKVLRYWKREHWDTYAIEVGLTKEPDKQFKTTKELRSALKKASLYPGQNGQHERHGGRDTKEELPVAYTAVEMMEAHILEPIEVRIPDTTQEQGYRTEKVAALKVMLDQLRRDALDKRNSANERTRASEAYMDRILGKPKQAVELTGTIKTEEQEMPTPAETAAAKAYEDALEKGLPVPSPLSQ